MAKFFAMGGYAAFVWPAIGITALVLGALFFASWRSLRRREAELDAVKAKDSRPRAETGDEA